MRNKPVSEGGGLVAGPTDLLRPGLSLLRAVFLSVTPEGRIVQVEGDGAPLGLPSPFPADGLALIEALPSLDRFPALPARVTVGGALWRVQSTLQPEGLYLIALQEADVLAGIPFEGAAVVVNGRISQVNPALCELLSCDGTGLLGRSPTELIPPTRQAEFLRRLAQADEAPWETEVRNRQGDEFHAEVRFRRVPLLGREARGFTVRDISARIEANRARNESDRLYSELFENANDFIYVHDLRGVITDINPAALRIMGYTREEAIGRNLLDIIVPEHVELARRMTTMKLRSRGEHTVNYEIDVLTKDGRRISLELNTRLIHRAGGRTVFQGIGRDITERKRIEAELKFRLEFEELITSISTYLINLQPGESTRGIQEALQAIGEFASIDRAYVLLVNPDEDVFTQAIEWTGAGVTPRLAEIAGTPLYESPWLAAQLETLSAVRLADVADLPDVATAERMRLQYHGTRSMVGVPLIVGSTLVGYLGIETVHQGRPWSEDMVALLRIVGEIFVNALQRDRTHVALIESEQRYKLAARGANDGLWDWDLQSNRIYYSERWKSMLGYAEAEVSDAPNEWLQRVHPDDIARLQLDLKHHLDGETSHFENEHRILHRDGTYRWMLSRGLAVRDPDDRATRMAGSQTDITHRKEFEERLLHDALHDPLTSLPNRALFLDRLERCMQRGRFNAEYLFAVLFLDFDRFKIVNDSLGHATGDQFLIALSARLQACMRPNDTVARLGGDEFAILIDDLGERDDALRLAERIQDDLSRPILLEGQEVFTTVSIGIAYHADGYLHPEELLRDADTAMYRAKSLGKARHVVFDAGMRVQALERLRLETDLRWAAERGDFRLYYQPIIHLESGRIAGFEALLRWNHPQRGMIPAPEFIPVVEETGLIQQVGQWVLQEACRQLGHWQSVYPAETPLTMSVNLSPRQFAQPDFLERLTNTLDGAPIARGSLKLEITESFLMDHAGDISRILNELKARDVHLHIDDFGTGYSSLAYLHRFPVDALKIDRSFIRGIESEGNNTELVRTILSLGSALKMDVIAEGVETEGQLATLRRLGCPYAQGFLFSFPIEAGSIETLLTQAPTW